MYIAKSTSRSSSGKVYESILLRESYRENGRVKNRTLANLSGRSSNEIEAIKLALKNKDNPQLLSNNLLQMSQGKSIGGIYVLHEIAKRLGISKALGNSFHAKLALWLIFARIIEQGSRLSAARLDSIYDISSVIDLQRGFDENDFYDSLHWLAENQDEIEEYLFKLRMYSGQFYWYDVTSSYFEGMQNALAAYGHNRDKKKRKKQIVIGLLSINNGIPISVEAFLGNTQDTQTFQSQLEKLKSRFGCKNVIIIGDRGMIRKKQKLLSHEYGFKFITALTLPEVNSLINAGYLKLADFDGELKSICIEGTRYIYRRNPGRAKETQRQRQERLATAQKRVDQENEKLQLKPNMSANLAKTRTKAYVSRLCINEWADIYINKRQLYIRVNEESLKEKSKFDGCYIWTTELGIEEATDREVYDRYKDLKYVEDDFRTFKTDYLEVRPIHVRTRASTKGHLFITMLAHMIVRELRQAWSDVNITVQEGLRLLSLTCQNSIEYSENLNINMIPTPSTKAKSLLEALNIKLPKTIKLSQPRVVTRHKTKKST